MPYIKPDKREKYQDLILTFGQALESMEDGDLNYVLFTIFKRYLEFRHNYTAIRNIRAELRECHDEIGRRILTELEQSKILENGDV